MSNPPALPPFAMSLSALYLTRVGQLACYDRVVFDINGPRHAELLHEQSAQVDDRVGFE